MMFGDGREERMSAFDLEMRLQANPVVRARREAYERSVAAARSEAKRIGKAEVIARLCARNPAYIRELLETEDDRFGGGSLAERFARSFFREFQSPDMDG